MRDFQRPGRSIVIAENGMAATSHPLASKVAIQMLEQGGTAADATVAAAVLLGVCEPHMTGIGGDAFALIKPAGEERLVGLNGSGVAPAALDAAALRTAGDVIDPASAAAVTVPGAVDALVRLATEWGRLGVATCLAPAIHYAEQGVPVAPRVALDWSASADALRGAARQDFLLAGAAPRVGQVFRAPKQAEALRRIAMDGRAGFYEGEVAEDMVAALRGAGGVHTLDDFAEQATLDVAPIAGHYKGQELVELPPNGQGAAAILMAAILERFDLSGLDPFGVERTHLEA
ncbi:MAG: gamma-glutamyltransferase, partial [Pseudomonadota bacterium]